MARPTAKRAAHHLIVGLVLSVTMGGVSIAADGERPTWRELNDRGTAAAAEKSWSEAEAAFRQALDLLEQVSPNAQTISGQTTPEDDARVAVVAANLAMVELAQGDVATARGLLERALAIRRAVFGDSELGIAALLNNLGELERRSRQLERARELHEAALVMRRALREPGHPEIAESLNNLGVTLSDLGMLDAADGMVREALAVRQERFGATHKATLESAANAAAIAIAAGDLAAAEALLRATLEAIAADDGAAAPDDELVAYLWRNLVEVLLLQNADDDALLACEELVADLPASGRQATTDLVAVCARAFNRVGAEDRATQLLEQQLERLAAQPEALPEAQLQLRWSLAETAASAGNFEQARERIDAVIDLLGPTTDGRLPLALNNRAFIAFELGRPLDAEADLQAALAAIATLAEPVDPDLERDVLNNLASVLRALDRGEEAAAVEERLLGSLPAAGPADGSTDAPGASPPPSGD